MQRIKKLLLYAGTDRQQYLRLRTAFMADNMRLLRYYSIIMSAYYSILAAFSVFQSRSVHLNSGLYLLTALSMLLIFVFSGRARVKASAPAACMVLVYSFMSVMYASSIYLTMIHPTMVAVTYIGVLLVLPLLFAARPLNTIILQCIFVAVFCVCVRRYKVDEIAAMDIWNGITFLAISVIALLLIVPLRIQSLCQAEDMMFLSRHDLLTGVRNRNGFETFLQEQDAEQSNTYGCIYADVNGLHQMNNTQGHEAGDRMLCAVASRMRERFGEENTYRIGGDEFIAFAQDRTLEELESDIRSLEETMQVLGYHVSFGAAAVGEAQQLRQLLKLSEQRMYESKKLYYTQPGAERRGM